MRAFLRILFLLTLIVLIAAAFTAWWGKEQYTRVGPLQESKTLIFKKGSGFTDIVETLAYEGVIRYPLHFKVVAALTDKAHTFKAGEYDFPAGINVQDVMDMLSEGRVVVHKITIPEGLIVAQVVEALNKEEVLEGEIDPAQVPEGSLLPETYHFTYGDTRSDLILRMQKSMREVVKELWPTRKEGLPIKTPKEALILASIVERETNLDSERRRVAAVYINRLNKGMRLQADPTTLYGIYRKTGEMRKRLTYVDLVENSPYNTYVHLGLPPTPIACPGRASIAAVIDPLETKELYFVADGTGGHNFSESLKEHNKNVRAFRAARKEAEAESKAEPKEAPEEKKEEKQEEKKK